MILKFTATGSCRCQKVLEITLKNSCQFYSPLRAIKHHVPAMIAEVPKLQCRRNLENSLRKVSSLFPCLPANAAVTVGGSCWGGWVLAHNQQGQADFVASWQRSPPRTKMFLFLLMPRLNSRCKCSWLIWAMSALARKHRDVSPNKKSEGNESQLVERAVWAVCWFWTLSLHLNDKFLRAGLAWQGAGSGHPPHPQPSLITGRGRVTLGESFCIPVRGYSARN